MKLLSRRHGRQSASALVRLACIWQGIGWVSFDGYTIFVRTPEAYRQQLDVRDRKEWR